MSYRREVNKSSTYKPRAKNFILPMLDIKLIHIGVDHETQEPINYFIGMFLAKEASQVVMVMDNIDYEPLKMDIYKLQNNPYYVDSKYDDEDKEVCLLFDIPKEYLNDYKLFKQGKYSKFSDKYKALLEKTYGGEETRMKTFSKTTGLPDVSMYDAIHPSEERITALTKELMFNDRVEEVLSPPDIEQETYKTIQELKGIYEVEQ